MPKASNGADRGTCIKSPGHMHRGSIWHGNNTCPVCGVLKTKQNASPRNLFVRGDKCRKCCTDTSRSWGGYKPRNAQRPGEIHKFLCGCEGVLPQKEGQSNFFASAKGEDKRNCKRKRAWICRVSGLLNVQRQHAKKHGHRAADANTPHSVIREMMRAKNCILCGEPLVWKLKIGQTPHLHHDHETGEQIGFSHFKCNTWALQKEVDRLKKENTRLKMAA